MHSRKARANIGLRWVCVGVGFLSPEAVNISNVAALVDTEGKPNFKYVVEGANLFLTQQARLHLEKRKVILFKDSSTNKGTISSYSVLL